MSKYGVELTTVPRDLYYHEVAYVRGLEAEIERLRAIEKAAQVAYDYHMTGYGEAADFDANTQLALMDALGRALEVEPQP